MVGCKEGCPVGQLVGCRVGNLLGHLDGWLVGLEEGWPVGLVGSGVGVDVGGRVVIVNMPLLVHLESP